MDASYFRTRLRMCLVAAAATVICSTGSASTLSNYYANIQPSYFTTARPSYDPNAIRTATPPLLHISDGRIFPVSEMMVLRYGDAARSFIAIPYYYFLFSRGTAWSCRNFGTYTKIPTNVVAGQIIVDVTTWYAPGDELCGDGSFGVMPPSYKLGVRDVISIAVPGRRIAEDGSQYDASRMTIVRNGVPWASYYWGYRLGLVASTVEYDGTRSDIPPEIAAWPAVPLKEDEFELTALPPPWVEDDVVEYVNRREFPNQPDGQFFYAVLASDKALLDTLPNWSRTGKSFRSGGYVTVCRFYGGKNGGPNTHFYSADDKECEALKQNPRLSYEGQTFAVNVAMPAKTAEQQVPGALRDCPRDSVPLYRLYNNASASNGRFVSNHRYTTDRADVAAFVAKGWVDEGHAMCVPR
ncbi:MAG: hypothetical protein LC098_08900 [Burkholderiales bacterium]|nr:hypothetical protein [Burkholderiales bacterium]